MPRFTICFATDLHGSERCFRKFFNAGKFYGADAVGPGRGRGRKGAHTRRQLAELRDNPDQLTRAFEKVISQTLEQWLSNRDPRGHLSPPA